MFGGIARYTKKGESAWIAGLGAAGDEMRLGKTALALV